MTTYTILRQEMRMNNEGFASWYAGTAIPVASSTNKNKLTMIIDLEAEDYAKSVRDHYGFEKEDVIVKSDIDAKTKLPVITVDAGPIYWIFTIASCKTL